MDAGTLKVASPFDIEICNYVLGASEGEFPTKETTGALCTYAETTGGITMDSSLVPTTKIGTVTRDFLPGNTYPELVRVDENKLYQVRWHLTSTQQSNRNTFFRMRARAVKFAWSQKLELGGAWGTGGQWGQPNPNNSISQQTLPGIGCQNPDRYTTDTQGGWYTLMMTTPMSVDIRPEFPAGTPLPIRMPYICAQPGPGVDANSQRDFKLGCDLMDTFSNGWYRDLELGNYTLDRIEVRVYDAVPD